MHTRTLIAALLAALTSASALANDGPIFGFIDAYQDKPQASSFGAWRAEVRKTPAQARADGSAVKSDVGSDGQRATPSSSRAQVEAVAGEKGNGSSH